MKYIIYFIIISLLLFSGCVITDEKEELQEKDKSYDIKFELSGIYIKSDLASKYPTNFDRFLSRGSVFYGITISNYQYDSIQVAAYMDSLIYNPSTVKKVDCDDDLGNFSIVGSPYEPIWINVLKGDTQQLFFSMLGDTTIDYYKMTFNYTAFDTDTIDYRNETILYKVHHNDIIGMVDSIDCK